ncbi:hypothetical protein DM01DRAFT_1006362 [Hesseltinella vesiculosa]|uniref:Uncharacterized protein n=1 Tax=Hesseltinella vesiculosa TaxID=101127 RepID=A0A1X2GYS6_9FUNG|nr:hypothetical protein DM01DRAFT_1006362 [Hesseltinella vesiculosa]
MQSSRRLLHSPRAGRCKKKLWWSMFAILAQCHTCKSPSIDAKSSTSDKSATVPSALFLTVKDWLLKLCQNCLASLSSTSFKGMWYWMSALIR